MLGESPYISMSAAHRHTCIQHADMGPRMHRGYVTYVIHMYTHVCMPVCLESGIYAGQCKREGGGRKGLRFCFCPSLAVWPKPSSSFLHYRRRTIMWPGMVLHACHPSTQSQEHQQFKVIYVVNRKPARAALDSAAGLESWFCH